MRKISDSRYNYRLKRQCIKQSKFDSNNINAPKIFNKGFIDNRFFFDMQYVQGKSLSENISTLSVNDIQYLITLLFDNIYKSKTKDKNVNNVFLKKIFSLEYLMDSYPNLSDAFFELKHFDYQYTYKSPCHGDLTLENIIISQSNKIYLIDFLDSFYNSWTMDIAKLLQDLECKWSFRNLEPNATRDIRLLIGKESLINKLSELEDANKIIDTIYHELLLNLIRIYPYTKEKSTIVYLNSEVEKVLKIINSTKKEVCL